MPKHKRYDPTNVGQFEAILDDVLREVKWDDSSRRTSERFLDYLSEFLPTVRPPMTVFDTRDNQLVVASPIQFSSMCQHHLLPFLGHAHVGYVSDGKIIGLSKIPRLVEWVARRPSTQEAMTTMIVDELKTLLKPKGVHVVIEAVHTCACARGIRKVGMSMKTSLPTGVFRDNAVTRQEFLSLIDLQGAK